ncbi:MAG: signal peptidase I [Lachnospiraceae bacterium]|nr:signal peptidase I [Lachnospiraceae bacterium]
MESEELPEIKLEPTGGESELKPKIQPTPTIPDSEIYFDAINDDLLEPKARNDSYDTEEEYRESHPFLRGVLSTCICILTALVLSLFITKYVAYHTSVEGSSMRPTLINGDQLIVEKLSYYLHDPERFDIVVFPFSEDVSYIKRVIGLPGETVQIRDGLVYINGELLEEKYGEETIHEAGLAANEILLGEDEYFVLGDNRNASVDSRTDGVGMISKEEILGRAWYRVYPFDRASLLK